MKSILERWHVSGATGEIISTTRGAHCAQAGAEQQLGNAENELAAIRKQLGIVADAGRPQGTSRR